MLADGGRFVIRYDHRDTGRSVTYEPGRPGTPAPTWSPTPPACSTRTGIPAGHVVGVSAGGGVRAAARARAPRSRPARSSSSARLPRRRSTATSRHRPSAFGRFVVDAEVDWSDAESVIDYLVGYSARARGRRAPVRRGACARSRAPRRRARARLRGAPEPRRAPGRASARRADLRRSPRRRSSSTAPPIRCSRSSTAKRWPRRSPAQPADARRRRSRRRARGRRGHRGSDSGAHGRCRATARSVTGRAGPPRPQPAGPIPRPGVRTRGSETSSFARVALGLSR